MVVFIEGRRIVINSAWYAYFSCTHPRTFRFRLLLGRSRYTPHTRHPDGLVSLTAPRDVGAARRCRTQQRGAALGRHRRRYFGRRLVGRTRRHHPAAQESSMTEKQKLVHLSQPQRSTLEGLSNRRPQLPTDPIRAELVTLGRSEEPTSELPHLMRH